VRRATWLALLLGAVVAAGCGSGSSAPKGLSDLRVCSSDAFSSHDAACRRDEAGTALTSARFYCSARVGDVPNNARFSGRFLYDGEPFPRSSRDLPENVGTAWIDIFTGGPRLPGGRWTCEMTVAGRTVRKSFSSGGPTTTVFDVAACPTDDTTAAGQARVCDPEKASTSLPPISSVTCSATFARAGGQTARLDLLYRGKPAHVTFSQKLPLPVTAFGVQISKRGANLPGGPYLCVFSLDGKALARQGFTIRG
jgi:hypothetical protein